MGLDVGKASVTVCVRTPGTRRGSGHSQTRTFKTTTGSLAVTAPLVRSLLTSCWRGHGVLHVVGLIALGNLDFRIIEPEEVDDVAKHGGRRRAGVWLEGRGGEAACDIGVQHEAHLLRVHSRERMAQRERSRLDRQVPMTCGVGDRLAQQHESLTLSART